MGMTVARKEQYEAAVRKLFPQGEYWDKQFANPQSDISLFVQAKAQELHRFRLRMSALLDEGRIDTATETLSDWERVLLEKVNYGKSITERRLLLKSVENDKSNRTELQKIAAQYGLSIKEIAFPYRPRFFGFSKFATERVAAFAAFAVPMIVCSGRGLEKQRGAVKAEWERQRFSRMRCGRDRLSYFPLSGCIESIARKSNFVKRFQAAVFNGYISREKPFREFEAAVSEKLPAGHMPIFEYGGE